MSETILLITNTPEFTNDLAEEIRLFLPDCDIVTDGDASAALIIQLHCDTSLWTAKAAVHGSICGEYTFCYPAVSGDALTIKRHMKRCVKTAVFRLLKGIYPDCFVPWGSLTGIRPTKLMRDLETEMSEKKAEKTMAELFSVDEKKIELTKEILSVQRPFISSARDNDVDIYIGIPYCKTRCLYCSFPSDVRTNKTDMRPYIDALKDDIRRGSDLLKHYGYNVRATYMGGGTPTVLTEDELSEVLEFAHECYGTWGDEFTVEAGRPDTITPKKLEILKSCGANRISVNPQTMNDETLKLIGRSHTSEELKEVYYAAREMGFCINTDIITCLPGEGMRELMHTMECIRKMRPDNLTVHTLALKNSSKLREVYGDEGIRAMMPKAQTANEMVEYCTKAAHDMGMKAYYMYRQKYMRGNLENVGYTFPGNICIYNIDMMEETVSIMAHGAGSMSKRIYNGQSLRVERIPNPKDIATYIGKMDRVYEVKAKMFER